MTTSILTRFLWSAFVSAEDGRPARASHLSLAERGWAVVYAKMN